MDHNFPAIIKKAFVLTYDDIDTYFYRVIEKITKECKTLTDQDIANRVIEITSTMKYISFLREIVFTMKYSREQFEHVAKNFSRTFKISPKNSLVSIMKIRNMCYYHPKRDEFLSQGDTEMEKMKIVEEILYYDFDLPDITN